MKRRLDDTVKTEYMDEIYLEEISNENCVQENIKELKERIEYHLGLPLIVKENQEEQKIEIGVSMHGLGRHLECLMNRVSSCMDEEINQYDNTYEINRYFSKVLTKLLFGKDYENRKVYRFIRMINILAGLTYENDSIETGIYIADEEHIERLCEKNNWNIIRGNENDFDEIIYRNKPMRKLVNNQDFAYYFDKDLNYIGIISNNDMSCSIKEKIRQQQEKDLENSIIEQVVDICDYFADHLKDMILNEMGDDGVEMENIIDGIIELYQAYQISDTEKGLDNILYIEVRNNRIKYYLNSYAYIEERNGEWRLFEYLSLVAPLVGNFFLDLFFAQSKDGYASTVNAIYKLLVVIKEMSINNTGGLIVFCKEDAKINEIITPDYNVNFVKLFGSTDAIKLLKLSNKKLINLISVDGGSIINSQLELMDFGRIIKNNMSDCSEYGARTNAALAASEYGLAIKISEDGDVTLYKKGNIVKRYEKF